MRLRRLISGAVGGAGVAALVNRAVARRADELPPALPGTQGTYRWRGFDVAYTEAGDPDDPDLLLLHGVHAAASSDEFRPVFDALADEYHVLAPDLPGFGRSDRPPVSYEAGTYEAFVRDFARDLTDRPVVVATSLTGAYAATAAKDVEFEHLVLVCPTADTGPVRPWLRSLLRSPLVGTFLFNLLVSNPSLRWFNRRDAYYAPVDDATVEYQWLTTHQPGARFAPASFVGGYLDPEDDLSTVLATLDAPVTLVWGRNAVITTLAYGRLLAEEADARLVVFEEARLLPHAEHPEGFAELLVEPEIEIEGR